MKFRQVVRWERKALAALLIFSCAVVQLHAKPIRLRNQVIPTQAAKDTDYDKSMADDIAASGLFLVQFDGAPQPAWREQLRKMGVELLRYVPEDAFVARFDGVRPAQVMALKFVRWVGPYRAEYKLHRALQQAANAPGQTSETVRVSVLLSPRATPQETAQARRQMHSIQHESKLRMGTVIRGRILAGHLNALAQSDAVLWIEPSSDMKLFDEVSSKIVAGDGGLHKTLSQSLGFDGTGVTVSMVDSGLNNGDAGTMHPDLFGRTPAFFYYGLLTDAADEHGHGTHVAGIVAGNGATGETDENGALYGLGVASGASIVAQRIFDADGNYALLDNNFPQLTQDATGAGAVIGSNSWGQDNHGSYDLNAAEFDELVRDADTNAPGDQPYILVFSAGNAGPGSQTIGTPAVAKNVVATGASENNRTNFPTYGDGPETMVDFSSRGPCEDGRIKPDLVAPGSWIASLKSASATDANAWAPIDTNYFYMGGTSQAAPHVSGAAAVFVQYYRAAHTNATPSPALVKAALINSAVGLGDVTTNPVPNMDEGWGRLNLAQFFDSQHVYEYVDQSVLLTNGQTYERQLLVAGSDEPLKVTLAYTDVPGLPSAIPALVNDLDLEVVAPDGRIYRGNQFSEGESVPDAPGRDNTNNVEGVYITAPRRGEYTVRVRASSVVEDARADTLAVDQDFALAMSGHLPLPGEGVIFLDRGAYSAPSQIKIKLIDSDLAGASATNVLVQSTSEPAGENCVLLPFNSSGTFTGAIATATGPVVPDDTLQISNGDIIQVLYFDTSAGTNRIATARADLVPPVLTNVAVTNVPGQTIIQWRSDEPADSVVHYGQSLNLALSATNSTLTTNHSVALINLAPEQTYYFLVVSADEAGNLATNDNSGTLYSFVAPPWSDSMDTGAVGWSVTTNGSSDSQWTLGVPNNGLQTSAHSPPNAWGSNLNGDPIAQAQTSLISPPIYLTAGDAARLDFWHSYDFTPRTGNDVFETGQLLILTNSQAQPIVLATFTNVSDTYGDWAAESIDLTPYIGQVIQLVWSYQLLSYQSVPRPGWLVDDVSVTASNFPPGNIQITKNLWQGQFFLSGPINTNGGGIFMLVTNAPVGAYVVSFGDVAYYWTPPPQTNTLTSGGTVVFTGQYTFPDVNNNGISDLWELEKFGVVDTNRTQFTDTDGDGATDWEEFIAGTDPNNPPPHFSVTARLAEDGSVLLEWPSAPGCLYQVWQSTDAASWTPFSGWIQATDPTTNVTVVPTTDGLAHLFRVQALPNPNGPASVFRVTAQALTNGFVRLEWPSTSGRGYLVHGSTNGAAWAPYSGWMQATGAITGFTLPPFTNGAPYLFRVEVKP